MFPRSLRALTLLFFMVFLTATVMTGVATLLMTQRTITRLVDERIAGESREVVGPATPAEPGLVAERITLFASQRDKGDVGFMLADAQGHVLAGNVTLHRRLPIGYSTLSAADRIPGLTHGRAFVRDIGNGIHLTTLAETEPFDNYNSARIRIYILGFGSIILIVVGGISLFGIIISRRIGEMRRTADAIIDGDMQRRVPLDGSGSEFDQQALAFNRMLDRISALMAGIANVSSDIAHDLRTPLGRLRGQLTRLRHQVETPQARDEVESAIAQSDDLLAMFAAILRIAEVEGGDRRASFALLDLGELVADAVQMMEPVAEAEMHQLGLANCTPLTMHGDRQLLNQALINLIENAIRHTPAGSRIRVSLKQSEGHGLLSVADDGPGIPADRRVEAVRRFGRLDKARRDDGYGLGLPLVGAIARLHRGQMMLEDAGPGLRVVLVLPIG